VQNTLEEDGRPYLGVNSGSYYQGSWIGYCKRNVLQPLSRPLDDSISEVDYTGGSSPPPDSLQTIASIFRRTEQSSVRNEQWRAIRMAIAAARPKSREMVRSCDSVCRASCERSSSLSRGQSKLHLSEKASRFSSVKHLSEWFTSISGKNPLLGAWFPTKGWDQQWDRSFKRAYQICLTLASQAFIFGYDALRVDWTEQLLRWAFLDRVGIAVEQLKKQTVILSAIGRQQSFDTAGLVDKPGFLLTPHYARWLLGRLRKSFRSTTSLAMAEDLLLGVKRGIVSAKDELVKQSVGDLLKDLSRHKETNPLILDEISRTCRELTGGEYLRLDRRPSFRFSRRAGVEAPISVGGIEGYFLRRMYGESPILTRELISMFERRAGSVQEMRGIVVDVFPEWCLHSAWWKSTAELAETEITVIREPCKLRPITKGTPTLYGILKPYQKIEWNLLKGLDRPHKSSCASFFCKEEIHTGECERLGCVNGQCDCEELSTFTLTGKESTSGVWSDALNRPLPGDSYIPTSVDSRNVRFQPWSNSWFISGDYKASTNEVHMDCTTVATQALWDPSDWPLINKGLGAQRIRPAGCPSHWPEGAVEIVQSHGQLMGSPLSFPILCIINAAIGRFAFEKAYNRKFLLSECPMLINGDDFVARGDVALYKWWSWAISEVGWQESVGKSFFSREFAQMNSQTRRPMWVVDCYGRANCFFGDSLPYFNYGNAFSMKKCVYEQNEPSLSDCATRHKDQWKKIGYLPSPWIPKAKAVYIQQLEDLGGKLQETACLPTPLSVWNGVGWGGFGLVEGIGDADVASCYLLLKPTVSKPEVFDAIGNSDIVGPVDSVNDPSSLTHNSRAQQLSIRLKFNQLRTERRFAEYRELRRKSKGFLEKEFRDLYRRGVDYPVDKLAKVYASRTYSVGDAATGARRLDSSSSPDIPAGPSSLVCPKDIREEVLPFSIITGLTREILARC